MFRKLLFLAVVLVAGACLAPTEDVGDAVPATSKYANNPLRLEVARGVVHDRVQAALTEESPVPIPTPTPEQYPGGFIAIPGTNFEMMDTHITAEQYKHGVDAGAVPPAGDWFERDWSTCVGRPVTYVTPEWATAYAAWLTEGSEEYVYALPSPEQWNAVMGDGVYPFGDDPAVLADINIMHPNDGVVEVVKSRPADTSPYGIRDMCGNAFDILTYNESAGMHYVRGASAWNDEYMCRNAYTDSLMPRGAYSAGASFRLVRVANPTLDLPPMEPEPTP